MAQMGSTGSFPLPPLPPCPPFSCFPPSFAPFLPPIPFLISLLSLCIPIHGSALGSQPLLGSPAQLSVPPVPSVLLGELLHGIHFFPHLLRSVADGWSRRSLHEEPAHLLPVESTHPVNSRADLCCVSRSWDFQPLKFREEGKPLSAGSS